MRSRRPLLVLVCLLLAGCSAVRVPEPEGPLTGDALVSALRDGGLVLFLRHTKTTEDGVDDLSALDDCASQRELTDAGRQDARDIRRALAELQVPVGKVLASPFCRTIETAELAFGRADVEPALLPLPSTAGQSTLEAARALLAAVPPAGTNTALVSHISHIRPVTGHEPEEGGTLVFRPDGKGSYRLVAEVPPGGWPRLAARS